MEVGFFRRVRVAGLARSLVQSLGTAGLVGLLVAVPGLGCETDKSGLPSAMPMPPAPGRPEVTPPPTPEPDAGPPVPPTPKPDASPADVAPPDLAPVDPPPKPPWPTGVGDCTFGGVTPVPVAPEIMLVFDRSASMRKPIAGTGMQPTRWSVMSDGLADVLQMQAPSAWGLKLFPSMQPTTEGPMSPVCHVTSGADIPVGPGNLTQIVNRVRGTAAFPGAEGSPLAPAIAEAVSAFPRKDLPRFLVLASDGVAGCPPATTANAPAVNLAIAAVENAANNNGVRTFVIGTPATGVNHTILNELALKGREPLPGPTRYRVVQNKAQMMEALNHIIEQLGTCLITGGIPIDNDAVALYMEGGPIARDPNHLNGWDYGPDYGAQLKSIRLYGAACDRMRSGPRYVRFIHSCKNVPVP